jgi:hypothetical protein
MKYLPTQTVPTDIPAEGVIIAILASILCIGIACLILFRKS